MLPRVLYVDDKRALELNWFGLGALQVRLRAGGVRRAHPAQKQVFLAIVQHFEAFGQPVSASNPRCTHLMKEFAELLEHSPSSLHWQVMLSSDPREIAENYAHAA